MPKVGKRKFPYTKTGMPQHEKLRKQQELQLKGKENSG